MAKRIHRQEGFTLIELMIVILIIGILVGIAVPVFLAARGNAQAKSCMADQRNYETASDVWAGEVGEYPTAATLPAGTVGPTGTSTGAWPADYYNGNIVAATNMPACTIPSTGTITNLAAWGGTNRPEVQCSIAEHQR